MASDEQELGWLGLESVAFVFVVQVMLYVYEGDTPAHINILSAADDNDV